MPLVHTLSIVPLLMQLPRYDSKGEGEAHFCLATRGGDRSRHVSTPTADFI